MCDLFLRITFLHFRSLKRTTAEIQNYSFDLDLSSRRDSLEKHRDSTSQVRIPDLCRLKEKKEFEGVLFVYILSFQSYNLNFFCFHLY